jgi:hypothetical protein
VKIMAADIFRNILAGRISPIGYHCCDLGRFSSGNQGSYCTVRNTQDRDRLVIST